MVAQTKFLQAHLQYLAMINFEVDPLVLQPFLPPYTRLDFYQGKALVSVVGFLFNQTRVFGIRWPLHTNFEEVNLRFYVTHDDGKMQKRGVVFVSEIVPRIIISTLANLLYREHYSYMPMKHHIQLKGETLTAAYQWKNRKRWNSMEVEADASLSDIQKGSEEEFIFEHYWGYSGYNATTTIEYGVEHIVWQVHKVSRWTLNCDVEGLYGAAFVPFLNNQPSSVFLAKGSEVIIRKPRFITQ